MNDSIYIVSKLIKLIVLEIKRVLPFQGGGGQESGD